VVPSSLSFPAVASAALSGLSSFSFAVFAIFHKFSLDFSFRVATHACRGDIQPPSPLRYFKPFFSSPYHSQSSLMVFYFPSINQARTEQALLFFVSFSFLLCLCTIYP
jgi:hypothetical protein